MCNYVLAAFNTSNTDTHTNTNNEPLPILRHVVDTSYVG